MKIQIKALGLLLFIFSGYIFADSLNEYKNTCAAIGFQAGTEKFGDCVLKLRKKDLEKKPIIDSNQSTNNLNNHRKADTEPREEAKRKKEADDSAYEEAKRQREADNIAYEAAKRKREENDERLLRLREQELEIERQSAKAQENSAATQQKMFDCQNARTNMQEQCRNASQYPNNLIFAFTCGTWRGNVIKFCN